MKLKKLQENAMWHKLTEPDFKTKVINFILEQEETAEKLSTTIVKLEEDIQSLKKQLGVVNMQNIRLNRKTDFNQKANDDNTHTK